MRRSDTASSRTAPGEDGQQVLGVVLSLDDQQRGAADAYESAYIRTALPLASGGWDRGHLLGDVLGLDGDRGLEAEGVAASGTAQHRLTRF